MNTDPEMNSAPAGEEKTVAKQNKPGGKKSAPASQGKKSAVKSADKMAAQVKASKSMPAKKSDAPAKSAPKPAAAKPVQKPIAQRIAPKPAPKPAAKAVAVATPQFEIAPDTAAASPFWTPLNIVVLLCGLALFAAGAYMLGKIQYGGIQGGYGKGAALFVAGILLPCIAIPQIRIFLVPKKTMDQRELVYHEKDKPKT